MNIYCQNMFNFETPGEQTANRTKKFTRKYSSLRASPCVNVRVVTDYAILLDYILIATFFRNYLVLLWTVVLFGMCFCTYFPALHNYCLLWSPYVIGQTIIFLPCGFYLLLSSFFFSSPNLSGRRLDVYHISTHGVALVRI